MSTGPKATDDAQKAVIMCAKIAEEVAARAKQMVDMGDKSPLTAMKALTASSIAFRIRSLLPPEMYDAQ